MGTTTRFGIPYPELTDAPNGPQAVQNAAQQVEAWLARAIPCLSTERPTSPPPGMIIYETDTTLWLGYDGDSWEPLIPTGGTPATAEAQYSGSALQSVGDEATVVVAYGNAQVVSPHVEQAVKNAGHKFTLKLAGRWAVSTTVRFAFTNAYGNRRVSLFTEAASSDPLASMQMADEVSAFTANLSVVRRFTANTAIFATAWQDTGSGKQLDPGLGVGVNGGYVRINFAYIGP